MKKDVREVIQGEEPHLNNLLSQEDLSSFKGMVDELRDTWTKKQMFRTETEARFSVLQDNRYPTKAAKYWQCVREQSSYLDNLMHLSFDYRRNEAKIKWLEGKIEKEEDEYKATKYQIDLDECRFGKASMEKVARHRMREIKMWSKLKKEFNDGSFNDKDVNQHQLESYGLQYAEKAKTLTYRIQLYTLSIHSTIFIAMTITMQILLTIRNTIPIAILLQTKTYAYDT